jgi:peptidoglycan/LPS O-acetylase OafA/YrhL
MVFCKGVSRAKKKYQVDILRFSVAYIVAVLGSSWLVKHDVPTGKFDLYFWSILPAIPIIAMIARMGRYLQQERDEYQRLQAMYSILVGTAALLSALVVNDFVRSFAHVDAIPPFAGFVIFCVGMGLAHLVQFLRNRAADDE